jgi:hypothetical protein
VSFLSSLSVATRIPFLPLTHAPPADPNHPKRGLSAYMFFANEQRDKVREDNPGIKFGKSTDPSPHRLRTCSRITGEVGKMLGEKWKGLNDKQKLPYEAKAAADKKRYEEEKAAYTAVSPPLLLPTSP